MVLYKLKLHAWRYRDIGKEMFEGVGVRSEQLVNLLSICNHQVFSSSILLKRKQKINIIIIVPTGGE